MRFAAYLWIALCVIGGGWVLYDVNHEVHGDVDPIIGTDGPQFKQWLEAHDG